VKCWAVPVITTTFPFTLSATSDEKNISAMVGFGKIGQIERIVNDGDGSDRQPWRSKCF
jgi:hypothetical protein